MRARQIDREHGGQHCRTRLHVLDGRTDVGDRRRRAMLAGFQVGGQLGTGSTEVEHHLEQRFGLRRAYTSAAVDQGRRRTYLGKQIEQLTPIDSHIWEHFVADPRERGSAKCSCYLPRGSGNGFAQRFGHMELDMADFLITPRGALPHRLIKALRISPRLRVE